MKINLTVFTTYTLLMVAFLMPSSTNAENKATSFFGGKQIEVTDAVAVNNFVTGNGLLASELISSADGLYKVEEVLQGSGTYILQTSDSSDSPVSSVERIRACLNERPQLYTLAKVKNTATGETKTLGIPIKFNGEHGTIRLNAKGKPVCPA
jgi:hypothetical protein